VPTSTFRFKLTSTGAGYAVALSIDSGEKASTSFQFDLDPSSRLNQVIKSMVDGAVVYDDLRDVGANLFKGLVNGAVRDLFANTRRALEASAPPATAGTVEDKRIVLRLDLPAELRHLPWECLYEEERAPGFLLNDSAYTLVRDTQGFELTPAPPRRTLPVRMLVVIPEGSGLNVEKELHGLDVAVAKLEEAINLSTLSGQVTPDRLRSKMDETPWDIVHFIGHGQVVDGDALVRLNDENPENADQWVNGEIFASFFRRNAPRLVVLNCCYGGSQASTRTLSGLGPFLLRAGVPAVVAMQYEIPDKIAIKFAENFYGDLLDGRTPGRIDSALAAARLALYQNQTKDRPQSFVTPVLYLAPGHETILELTEIVRATEPTIIVPAFATASLPKDLIDAFAERRVVPVIGPDLFAVGAMRATPPPPGPRELARQLAQEACYPRMEYFQLSDVAAEETDVWLLPAVCQHYERRNERWRLLTAVQKVYKGFPPPPAIEQVAGWNVPGIICAYFDGLLNAAMAKQGRPFRAIHSVDEKAAGLHDETLVVHVRGVYSEEDSLVLTERDHELLLDRMMCLSSQVSDLTRKSVGRSLLYVGVSPRDPLIRRLTRALRGNGRNQGRMYFVSPDQLEGDAYWDDYNVKWLPMKLEEFMCAVTSIGSGAHA
jgi:CHAT domain/SIR2-like domain